jgi:hypothetical protein
MKQIGKPWVELYRTEGAIACAGCAIRRTIARPV